MDTPKQDIKVNQIQQPISTYKKNISQMDVLRKQTVYPPMPQSKRVVPRHLLSSIAFIPEANKGDDGGIDDILSNYLSS